MLIVICHVFSHQIANSFFVITATSHVHLKLSSHASHLTPSPTPTQQPNPLMNNTTATAATTAATTTATMPVATMAATTTNNNEQRDSNERQRDNNERTRQQRTTMRQQRTAMRQQRTTNDKMADSVRRARTG
jgi:hypothetical protein